MSLLRSLLSLLLAFLFVTFLFSAISSYTIGDLLQKDTLKQFVSDDLAPKLIKDQCSWLCQEESIREACIDLCVAKSMEQTDETVDDAIEELYDFRMFGINVEQMIGLMNNTAFFSLLSIIFFISIIAVSEQPLNTLGKALLTTSISLIIAGLTPNLIVGSSLGSVPILGDMVSYLSSRLEIQTKIAAVLLILGIFLLIVEKLENREK